METEKNILDRITQEQVKNSLSQVKKTIERMEEEIAYTEKLIGNVENVGTDSYQAINTAERLEGLINFLNQQNYSLTQPLMAEMVQLLKTRD